MLWLNYLYCCFVFGHKLVFLSFVIGIYRYYIFLIIYLHTCRVIKLTSPNLNYVIVFGAVMLLIGNIFLPFPSQNLTLIATFCVVSMHNCTLPISVQRVIYTAMQIARVFLSIGYDICFVVALVKTVRVAYIFKSVSPTKKVYVYMCL